jgi:hypothetical protein
MSARLIGRSTLSWKNCLTLSCIFGVFAIVGRASLYASEHALPAGVGLVLGLSIQLSVGTWFLQNRALSTAGLPVGLIIAAQISALALFLLLAACLTILGMSHLVAQLRP